MKNFFQLSLLSLAIGFSVNAHSQETPEVKEQVIGINDVFVPAGFDSQSDAYVVVSGLFPNGCYQWKGATVKDTSTFEHQVTSVARVSQGMCIQVLVPFSKDVRLGKLVAGKHTLRFPSADGTYLEKNLVVE